MIILAVAALLTLAAPPATFHDPRGDAGSAPDILTVRVASNDSEIRFDITLASPSSPGAQLFVPIDRDRNRSTGDRDGIDYLVVVTNGKGVVQRWEAGVFKDVGDLDATASGNVVTVAVAHAAVGSPRAFDFGVVGVRGNDVDAAPGNGRWTYRLDATAARLSFSPAVPRAGRLFAVRSTAPITCRAAIGGTTLKATGSCRWRIPVKARGRQLVLQVTSESLRKTFRLKIR